MMNTIKADDNAHKLGELRALLDEGEKAYAEGRFTTVTDPAVMASDISARGRQRTASGSSTST